MDWKSITFDWNQARAFMVTAEEGSLSSAARALGMTQPTLSRQVSSLEKHIGLSLFKRAGRGLELTPSGLSLLEHVRAMAEAANQFSLSATGRSNSLGGHICISSSEIFSTFILPPIITKLRQIEPNLEIELVVSNEESNLNRREADIAIRHFRPFQDYLITKKISKAKAFLYASSSYVQNHGSIKALQDLNQAIFLDFEKTGQLMKILNDKGLKLNASNFPVITKNNIALWELVKQGLAIGAMVENVGDREPMVDKVLPNLMSINGEIWLVTHEEFRTNKRVRFVFDFLANEIGAYFNHKPTIQS